MTRPDPCCSHTADALRHCHQHDFAVGNAAAERSTVRVMIITAVMMVAEIWAGWWYNSMALLADGWHMSSHAVAIGLSAFAYVAARRYARDRRFAFGTWKMEVLGAYTSALFLLGVAATMVFGSAERLLTPQPIHFREAIVVAVLGLVVNLVCALLLGDAHHGHDHGHDHGHGHDHAHHEHEHAAHEPHDHEHAHEHPHPHDHHHDLNLRSAYLHVLADAATSVLAIAALCGGMWFGWNWLDPLMGIVGAVLVALWARGLLRDSGRILLDCEMDHPLGLEIRAALGELDREIPLQLTDLHLWRVGKAHYACIISILTNDAALTPARVKAALAQHQELAHLTVEIHRPA